MATKQNILVVGATRGLGAALVAKYASLETTSHIYGTSRSSSSSEQGSSSSSPVTMIPSVDLLSPQCGEKLVSGLPSPASAHPLHTVIISAGLFVTDSLESPDWEAEVKMYTTSCVAPVALVSALDRAGYLVRGSKVVLVGSESGSIGLRHAKEGGGNYGHHGSKAAANMVGKLMSLDLADKGVAVVTLHPGFMRTEMTKGVGFDKYWDDGGAVTPEESADSLVTFINEHVDMDKTGEYWAPRGPRDIGTAEETLGKDLSTPLKLPW